MANVHVAQTVEPCFVRGSWDLIFTKRDFRINLQYSTYLRFLYAFINTSFLEFVDADHLLTL